ncbi:cationic peroxidase 1 [Ziziphus jujuba]|uniref:Peroxidase n=1 Tax=Ziziphus jujuba TaxID=326968 RepID=A0ABM3INS3_ZIZJJ|nr:cationic peroxidase 1 [Ziziphus jujuba]
MASFSSSSLSFFVTVMLVLGRISSQLSPNFYSLSCPSALTTIQTEVISAVAKERRMGASLLRLHFHDCFVQGCDGSVLLDDIPGVFTGEKNALPNANSLRGFEVIDTIKSKLESKCNATVSCADILAVAARDSVVALGGPSWVVKLGRRDSTNASLTDANSQLPSPFLNLAALLTSFANKGFDAKDMVALSGAHTVGQARCLLFRNRIYNEANIDPQFANLRKQNCSNSTSGGDDNNLASLDQTGTFFDSQYFKDLVELNGLLHSDQQLYNNGSTDSQVLAYKTNKLQFFHDFANAMVKMGDLSPLTGSNGQIRTDCRKINA